MERRRIRVRVAPAWVPVGLIGAAVAAVVAAAIAHSIPEAPRYGAHDDMGSLLVRGWCVGGEVIRPPPAAVCADGGWSPYRALKMQPDWERYLEAARRPAAGSLEAVTGIRPWDAVALLLLITAGAAVVSAAGLAHSHAFELDGDALRIGGEPLALEAITDVRLYRGPLGAHLDVVAGDRRARIGPIFGDLWAAEAAAQHVREAVPDPRQLPW